MLLLFSTISKSIFLIMLYIINYIDLYLFTGSGVSSVCSYFIIGLVNLLKYIDISYP